MPADVLTFRTQLLEGLKRFEAFLGQDAELRADIVAELVVMLSNHQEEGVSLFPVLFIGDDAREILESVDGHDAITLGEGRVERAVVETAFRLSAPLAEGREWSIFLEIKGERLTFGLFRTDQLAMRPTAFEKFRMRRTSSGRMIGLTRLGGSFIELRDSAGNHLYVDLSGRHEDLSPPHLIRNLLGVVTRDVQPQMRPQLEAFYYRLGIDLMHATHGTLVAVVPADRGLPAMLRDGVVLETPIQALHDIARFQEQGDLESYQRLAALGQLLRRMCGMDGITVLGTDGSLLAYHCFIQSSIVERRAGAIHGGARRRAFEALCSFLGREVAGAFYRSQDGLGEFRKAGDPRRE